jgi:hypothetical protein
MNPIDTIQTQYLVKHETLKKENAELKKEQAELTQQLNIIQWAKKALCHIENTPILAQKEDIDRARVLIREAKELGIEEKP